MNTSTNSAPVAQGGVGCRTLAARGHRFSSFSAVSHRIWEKSVAERAHMPVSTFRQEGASELAPGHLWLPQVSRLLIPASCALSCDPSCDLGKVYVIPVQTFQLRNHVKTRRSQCARNTCGYRKCPWDTARWEPLFRTGFHTIAGAQGGAGFLRSFWHAARADRR